MALQSSFLVALIALNWDFLSTESDGIALLVLTGIVQVVTLILYSLAGATDPGYVRNQIFESNYETTEVVEEDDHQQLP